MMRAERELGKYRILSEPVSKDEANKNIAAFFEAVSEAREKFHIPDVLCVVSVVVSYESGEGQATMYFCAGDAGHTESLAAYAFGQEQAQRREYMNQLLAGKNPTPA